MNARKSGLINYANGVRKTAMGNGDLSNAGPAGRWRSSFNLRTTRKTFVDLLRVAR